MFVFGRLFYPKLLRLHSMYRLLYIPSVAYISNTIVQYCIPIPTVGLPNKFVICQELAYWSVYKQACKIFRVSYYHVNSLIFNKSTCVFFLKGSKATASGLLVGSLSGPSLASYLTLSFYNSVVSQCLFNFKELAVLCTRVCVLALQTSV